MHTCDKRLKLSELKREFPMVDYSEVESAVRRLSIGWFLFDADCESGVHIVLILRLEAAGCLAAWLPACLSGCPSNAGNCGAVAFVGCRLTQGEEDPLWHPTEREPTKAVCDRAYDFLLWLRARPEK